MPFFIPLRRPQGPPTLTPNSPSGSSSSCLSSNNSSTSESAASAVVAAAIPAPAQQQQQRSCIMPFTKSSKARVAPSSHNIAKKSSPFSLPTMSWASAVLDTPSRADIERRLRRANSSLSTPALSRATSTNWSSDSTSSQDEDEGVPDALTYPSTPPTSEQVFSTVHTEFGHCANPAFRHTSQHPRGAPVEVHHEIEGPWHALFATYVTLFLVMCLGHLRDFFGKRFRPEIFAHLLPHNGYAPLNSDYDSFYTRRMKTRIDECFSQPVTGVAGRTILALDRYTDDHGFTFKPTGTRTRFLNISSYNYLGFAQAQGGCADAVADSLRLYGVASNGRRLEGATSDLHIQAEALVARFVGMEDALISSMGFATNSTIIPALVGKGCLVISDEYNHASIRFGTRLSGASIRSFKHNDMKHLERILRESISQGQPKTNKAWKKILVIVEGLYSMEGTLVDLPSLVALKERYKFSIYIDEAHSIGALGAHGRGVVDYFQIDPRKVDILMGTFTKSFGAAGGYIAGNKNVIDRLRIHGHSGPFAEAMSPAVLTQVVASMASIMGVRAPLASSSAEHEGSLEVALRHPGPAPAGALPSWIDLPLALRDGSEGLERLRRLAFNSRYLRRGLKKLGFVIYGHSDSPIVPLLLFNPGKMLSFHRLMRLREKTPILVVVVAYPAAPLDKSRVRFCVSSAHTKDDIDAILEACDEIGDLLDIKHGQGERWSIERVKRDAVQLVEADEA